MAAKGENLLSRILKRYFIDAMGSMVCGLFATLIIGVILAQLGRIEVLSFLAPIADVLQSKAVYGAATAVAVAWGLKADGLVIFSCAGVGAIGCVAGGPVGALIAAIVGAELGQLVSKKTPMDIVVTPLVTVITGGLVSTLAGPYIDLFMTWLGDLINGMVQMMPLPMGTMVGAIMGMLLVSPISSTALCIMLDLKGLAAGAAAAGCAAQMIGFAVASFRDNGVPGFICQGFCTGMLQLPNIMRRPQIWIAPTVASAVSGALSAAVFGMTNLASGAGMGSSGLVAQITGWAAMSATEGASFTLLSMAIVHFIVPAIVALAVDRLLRRIGWIKDGYMKIQSV